MVDTKDLAKRTAEPPKEAYKHMKNLIEDRILEEVKKVVSERAQEGELNIAEPDIPECLTFEEFEALVKSEDSVEVIGQGFQFHSIIYTSDVEESPDVRTFRAAISDVVFDLREGWSLKIVDDFGNTETFFRDSYLTEERLRKNPTSLPLREVWRVRYV